MNESETIEVAREKIQGIFDRFLSALVAAAGTSDLMRLRGRGEMADGADVVARCITSVGIQDVLTPLGEMLGEPLPTHVVEAARAFEARATAHLN